MNKAIKRAKEIYVKYGSDVEKIASVVGLEVLEVEMEGNAKEFYWGDYITLKEGLPEPEKRELIAHAIGHHLMHAGNHLSMQKRIYAFGNYHERQANVFAAYLLIPDEKLGKFIDDQLPLHEVSEKFDVTPQFANFRIKLAQHYDPQKFNFLRSAG